MQEKSAGQGKTAEQALRKRLVFLVIFTAAVLAVAGVAHASESHGKSDESHGRQSQAGQPAADHPDESQANAGSVKVDDEEVDDQPANHPHVACGLRIVVNRTFGAPVTIDLDAQPPTTRAGDDQRLTEVTLPAGDDVTDVIDLTPALAGITPHPQQGFHVKLTAHLPSGGEKHKVFWVSECPAPTTTSTTPTTVASARISGAVQTTTTVPTQVLGESFSKAPAATSLANTGNPLSPALAMGLVLGGLTLLGAARHASGRRLELSMRRVVDKER